MTLSVKLDRNLNKLTVDIPSSSPLSPLPMTWPQSCAQEYAGHQNLPLGYVINTHDRNSCLILKQPLMDTQSTTQLSLNQHLKSWLILADIVNTQPPIGEAQWPHG